MLIFFFLSRKHILQVFFFYLFFNLFNGTFLEYLVISYVVYIHLLVKHVQNIVKIIKEKNQFSFSFFFFKKLLPPVKRKLSTRLISYKLRSAV